MKTFEQVLQELGCKTPDDFYSLMAEHWGDGLDAILSYNPHNGKVYVGTIYSNDWFNDNCGYVLLLRLNLPDKKKFDMLCPEMYYEANRTLQRAQGGIK